MSKPAAERIDFRVSSRDQGITLIAGDAALEEARLLNPAADYDWEALQVSGRGVRVDTDSKSSARVIIGALDWGDVDGLVDRATWKLNLSSGRIVLGGVVEGRSEILVEPGKYWVTLYSFANEEEQASDSLIHLHKESDEEFLKTSMAWIPVPEPDEPLIMDAEETSEMSYEDEVTEELSVQDEDASPDNINVRLKR